MKRFVLLLALLQLQIFAFCNQLPVDETVKIGRLPNGLTYYIKENGYPKGRASLRLVVKAGSLHEEEHQRGLAHFLEHIVFRGSKHFQDWEIINYLESVGAKFGPDTNAFTAFDKTCYMLEIPLENEGVLDKGILILSDFAGRAILDGEMIERERDVIMDEYNIATKNPMARVMNKYIDHFFKGSRYAERLPLGKKEVIRGCDPEAIREFYRKWYRPDRMAVIAIGDFDKDVVESYIRDHFFDLELPADPVEDPDLGYSLPERGSLIIEEPEFSANIGGLTLIEEARKKTTLTKNGVKNDLLSGIFDAVLDMRLNRASKKHPAPFLLTTWSSSEISSLHRIEDILFFCFEDRPLDGLRGVYEEISILKQFGPTPEEWRSTVDMIKEEIAKNIANIDRIDHPSLVEQSISNFFDGTPHIAPLKLLEAKQEVLSEISLEDVALWAEDNIDLEEYHTLYVTPKKDLVSIALINECLSELEAKEWERPSFQEKQDFKVEARGEAGCQMPLILHPTDLEKREIVVRLIAKDGSAAFPVEWYPSLSLAPSYLLESGLANLDGTALGEALQAKNLGLHIAIRGNTRTITLSLNSEDDEFAFQLIQAIFQQKRFQPDVWANLVEKTKEMERNRKNDPYFNFFLKVDETIHSNHPFFALHSADDAKEELARGIMEKAFSNPEEFTMMVVGDFDQKRWKDLADCYLNFSSTKERLTTEALPLGTFPTSGEERIIYSGGESHSVTVIAYEGSFSFTPERKTTAALDAINHLLQHRLIEKLRQEYGDTYGVRTSIAAPFAPDLKEICFYISFTTEPEKAEKLKRATMEVISDLVQNGPEEQEIQTERELQRAARKQALQSNGEWLEILTSHHFFGFSIEELSSEEAIDREVTKEGVHEVLKGLFVGKPPLKFTLYPEK